MDRRTLSIVLGLALLVSFFLPYLNMGGMKISGLDIVKNAGESRDPVMTYIWLVFPLSGLMLLIGALNKGNYPGGRALWLWLPLLAILFILFIYPLINDSGTKFGDLFKNFGAGFGIGLWLAIAASVIGIFANPRR
jgi:hypothetical protein